MPPARPLEIRSVADQVYSVLLGRIVGGELPPGSRLRQESLADEFGISRTPLREALRRLASEGFVELAVNHGATVARHDLADPVAALTTRAHFEPAVARLAAEVRDPDGLQVLGRSLEPDAAFHVAVARVTGNPHLLRFAEMLWMTRFPAADGDASAEHPAIAAAIERGDPAEAERLSRAHLEQEVELSPVLKSPASGS